MQAYAIEIDNFNVQKHMILTTEATAPVIMGDYIIFTFQSNERTSFVGAAFDFDNYVKVHQFRINSEGVFILVIRKPNSESIRYRLIVDGLWMADPFNPTRTRKPNGIEISVLNIPNNFLGERTFPFTENGITHFRYRGEAGRRVYLAGSFNRWDPFMYHMRERSPGEYFISIRLPAGTHHYYFVVNGLTVSDDNNPNVLWDRDFRRISAFTIR